MLNKQDALNEIKKMESEGGYVVISATKDTIRLIPSGGSTEIKDDECFYNSTPQRWMKLDIMNLTKAMNIKTIVLQNGETITTDLIEVVRPKKFHELIKTIINPYGKKLIFFIKKTRGKKFVMILVKQKYITLAKPVDTHIEIFKGDFNGYKDVVPVFTDSDEYSAFMNSDEVKSMVDNYSDEEKVSFNGYRPILMKFKDIIRESKKQEIIINPASFSIIGKNSSLHINKSLIDFILEKHW